MTPNSDVLLQKQNTTLVEQVKRESLENPASLLKKGKIITFLPLSPHKVFSIYFFLFSIYVPIFSFLDDGSGKKMDSNSHCTTSNEQENEEGAEGPKRAVTKGRKRKQNMEENEVKKLKKNLVSKGTCHLLNIKNKSKLIHVKF